MTDGNTEHLQQCINRLRAEKPGVDFVSVGYVTHSAPSLDLGLDFSVE